MGLNTLRPSHSIDQSGLGGYTQEQAGEIQGASSFKNQLFINLGGGLFSTLLMMILAYTFINTVGQGWFAAAAYGSSYRNREHADPTMVQQPRSRTNRQPIASLPNDYRDSP